DVEPVDISSRIEQPVRRGRARLSIGSPGTRQSAVPALRLSCRALPADRCRVSSRRPLAEGTSGLPLPPMCRIQEPAERIVSTLRRRLGRHRLVQLGPQHLDLVLRLRQLLLQIVNLSLEALCPVLPALLPTSLTLGIGQGHVAEPTSLYNGALYNAYRRPI